MRLKFPLGNLGSSLFRSYLREDAKSVGLFGNFLLSSPSGFENLAALVQIKSRDLVERIVNKRRDGKSAEMSGRTTVAMVDDLSNEICCAADLTECTRSMHCDREFADAAEKSMRQYTALVETLNTTPELYQSLKESMVTEKDRLDEVDLRTANLLLEDFENSGVHLEKDKREKFVALSDEIFSAGVHFSNGVDWSVSISNEEAAQYGFNFNQLSSPWRSSNDYRIRRFTHSKFFEHSDHQEINLRNLIKSRHELAKLTGFESYAHRAQTHSVLRTYENVYSFLDGIIKSMRPKLEEEKDTIRSLLVDNSSNFNPMQDRVGEWDLDYAKEISRRKLLQEVGDLSKFFNFGSMLSGFETIVNKLYGLDFKVCLPEPGEVWDGNVLKLDVYRENGAEFLGTIYLDMDIRSTKIQGDCHFTVRCSKLMEDGQYQTPIVVLSLSVMPLTKFYQRKQSPSEYENVIMDPQHAENFFHEMGHAIHSMLGRTRYQHVAGTRCPSDFAEVPSHLMECFFNDPKVLVNICRDPSGQPMTIDEAKVMLSSRNIFGSIRTSQQALYALFDLQLHGPYAHQVSNGNLSTTDLFHKLANVALPCLERTPNYAYHHRISHLVTYGAKYYSYLVARAGASLIYKNLFSENPFSRENGLKWGKIQSFGGEYPSHYLLEKVLDRKHGDDMLSDVLQRSILSDEGMKGLPYI